MDQAKHCLYDHLAKLQQVLQGVWESCDMARDLSAIFNQCSFNTAAQGQAVQVFVNRYRAQLDTLRDELGEHLGRALPKLEDELYLDLVGICGIWSTKVRFDLLVRYLGFPYWDMLVYPVQALSGVGEQDHVEVLRISPYDATQLTPESPDQGKLKGSRFSTSAPFSGATIARTTISGDASMRRNASSLCCSMIRSSLGSLKWLRKHATRRSVPSSMRKSPRSGPYPASCGICASK